jgi:hypothetical protein
LARAHGGLHLLHLALQEILRGLLQLALVREVGRIRRVLTDDAQFAGLLTLVTLEGRIVFGLAERFEILGPTRERVLGLTLRVG